MDTRIAAMNELDRHVEKMVRKDAKRTLKKFQRKRKAALEKGKTPPVGINFHGHMFVARNEDYDDAVREQEQIAQRKLLEQAAYKRELKKKQEAIQLAAMIALNKKVVDAATAITNVSREIDRRMATPFGVMISAPVDDKIVSTYKHKIEDTDVEKIIKDAFFKKSSQDIIDEECLFDGVLESICTLMSYPYSGAYVISYLGIKEQYDYVKNLIVEMLENIIVKHTKVSNRRTTSQSLTYKFHITENQRTVFYIYRNNDLRIFELINFENRLLSNNEIAGTLRKHTIFVADALVAADTPRKTELLDFLKTHREEFWLGDDTEFTCECKFCNRKL
jgi:hypothetical protein